MELIDVYDELGRHRGTMDRADAHRDGWWHRVFHLLVVARRPHGPTLVLQRRAAHKTTFPGLIDLSATGHLEAGETPVDGVRELREELGIDVDADHLVALGVRRIIDETPEGTNRELCHVFLVLDDRPLADYAPDEAEVASVVEVDLDRFLDLVAGVTEEVTGVERTAGGGSTPVHLTRADLVPEPTLGLDDTVRMPYWTAVVSLAQRCVEGERRLSI